MKKTKKNTSQQELKCVKKDGNRYALQQLGNNLNLSPRIKSISQCQDFDYSKYPKIDKINTKIKRMLHFIDNYNLQHHFINQKQQHQLITIINQKNKEPQHIKNKNQNIKQSVKNIKELTKNIIKEPVNKIKQTNKNVKQSFKNLKQPVSSCMQSLLLSQIYNGNTHIQIIQNDNNAFQVNTNLSKFKCQYSSNNYLNATSSKNIPLKLLSPQKQIKIQNQNQKTSLLDWIKQTKMSNFEKSQKLKSSKYKSLDSFYHRNGSLNQKLKPEINLVQVQQRIIDIGRKIIDLQNQKKKLNIVFEPFRNKVQKIKKCRTQMSINKENEVAEMLNNQNGNLLHVNQIKQKKSRTLRSSNYINQ